MSSPSTRRPRRWRSTPAFDGVELHGANGYLIEQFLNPLVNQRTDGYGASIEGRNRLALEIARVTVDAVGRDRVGIRISPYGVFNGTGAFPDVQAQYLSPSDARSWPTRIWSRGCDRMRRSMRRTWPPSTYPARRATPTIP